MGKQELGLPAPGDVAMHRFDVTALPSRWGLRVGLAAAAFVAAAWLLAGPLLALLQSAPVSAADAHAAAWVHGHADGWTLRMLTVISTLHGTTGILCWSLVWAAVLARVRQRELWPCLLVAVPGGLLLNIAVKLAVQRARPELDYTAQALASFSFPSGHTLGATVLYGFVVVFLWTRSKGVVRGALLAAAIVMVLLVGASRIALGVHYFSDCIAAVIEGCLWLAICMAGFRSFGAQRSGVGPRTA
jgi:membrane-associated phospholipid phosphatase